MLSANVLCMKKRKKRTYCLAGGNNNGSTTSIDQKSKRGVTMFQVTENTPPDMLAGAMDLTVHLPSNKTVKMSVQRTTPMMDLLVQVATLHHLQLSEHTLEALGMPPAGGEVLPFKPNTPIGALDTQAVRVAAKGRAGAPPRPAAGALPFESTFRLKVHLPRNQLYVMRVGQAVLLEDVMRRVCDEKNLDYVKYQFRHPANLDQVLDPKRTLSEYKITEIHVVAKGAANLNQHFSTNDIIAIRKEEERKQFHNKTGGGVFNLIFKRGTKPSSGSVSSENRSISPSHSDDSRSVTPPQELLAPPAMERPKPPQRKRRPAPKPPQPPPAEAAAARTDLTICHSRNSSDSSGYHEASILSDNANTSLPRRPKATLMPEMTHKFSASASNLSQMAAQSKSTSSLAANARKKKSAPPPPPTPAPPTPVVASQPAAPAPADAGNGGGSCRVSPRAAPRCKKPVVRPRSTIVEESALGGVDSTVSLGGGVGEDREGTNGEDLEARHQAGQDEEVTELLVNNNTVGDTLQQGNERPKSTGSHLDYARKIERETEEFQRTFDRSLSDSYNQLLELQKKNANLLFSSSSFKVASLEEVSNPELKTEVVFEEPEGIIKAPIDCGEVLRNRVREEEKVPPEITTEPPIEDDEKVCKDLEKDALPKLDHTTKLGNGEKNVEVSKFSNELELSDLSKLDESNLEIVKGDTFSVENSKLENLENLIEPAEISKKDPLQKVNKDTCEDVIGETLVELDQTTEEKQNSEVIKSSKERNPTVLSKQSDSDLEITKDDVSIKLDKTTKTPSVEEDRNLINLYINHKFGEPAKIPKTEPQHKNDENNQSHSLPKLKQTTKVANSEQVFISFKKQKSTEMLKLDNSNTDVAKDDTFIKLDEGVPSADKESNLIDLYTNPKQKHFEQTVNPKTEPHLNQKPLTDESFVQSSLNSDADSNDSQLIFEVKNHPLLDTLEPSTRAKVVALFPKSGRNSYFDSLTRKRGFHIGKSLLDASSDDDRSSTSSPSFRTASPTTPPADAGRFHVGDESAEEEEEEIDVNLFTGSVSKRGGGAERILAELHGMHAVGLGKSTSDGSLGSIPGFATRLRKWSNREDVSGGWVLGGDGSDTESPAVSPLATPADPPPPPPADDRVQLPSLDPPAPDADLAWHYRLPAAPQAFRDPPPAPAAPPAPAPPLTTLSLAHLERRQSLVYNRELAGLQQAPAERGRARAALPNFKITTYDTAKPKVDIFEDETIHSSIGRRGAAEGGAQRGRVARAGSFKAEPSWAPTRPVMRSKSQVALDHGKCRDNRSVTMLNEESLTKSNSLFDVSGLQSLEVMRLIQTKLNTPTNSTEALESDQPDSTRYQPSKPQQSRRTPSINMGTWSDRPKAPVNVKADPDYKVNAPPAGVTIKINGSEPISAPHAGNVLIKIGQEVRLRRPRADAARPHSIAVGPPSADVSRVPIVRAVELKKPFGERGASITQIYGAPYARPASCASATLRDFSTNRAVPFGQANLRRTESKTRIDYGTEGEQLAKPKLAVTPTTFKSFEPIATAIRTNGESWKATSIAPPPPALPKLRPASGAFKSSSSFGDPKDALLQSIRDFGGKKGLRSVK